ncbi:spore germination protein [Paenibacillus sp. Pae108]|nr:spore germination protein [Paenibacillus sp. Pae108]
MQELFQESSDIVFRSFSIGKKQEIQAFLVAIDGLYEKTTVNENVLKPLMNLDFHEIEGTELLTYVEKNVLSMSSIKKERSMKKGIALLMQGDPILFVDGLDYVYVPGARAWEMRSIDEPVTETTVRGPREGFVGYIEEFIEDAPFSIFPTISNTERPDVVAARLLEGRAAIFIGGSTTVLIVPHLMLESFQSAEDYYSRPYYATMLRFLRLFAF